MALRNSYVSVLSAIKNATHSVTNRQIEGITNISANSVANITSSLEETAYIKADSNGNGWFTRRPKRDEINEFILGNQLTLDGITFQEMVAELTQAPAATTQPTQTSVTAAVPPATGTATLEDEYREILHAIKSSEHAMDIEDMPDTEHFTEILDSLIDNALIREHRDIDHSYFTRKPMRAKIDAFLAGGTLDALLAPLAVAATETENTDHTPAPTSIEDLLNSTPKRNLFIAIEPGASDEYLNIISAFRDLANAFLAQNGR